MLHYILVDYKSMETKQSNKALATIRWIGLLPIAVLTTVLSHIVVKITGYFTLSYLGITSEDFQGKLYDVTISYGFQGVAFVFAGAMMAPAYRVIVAFIYPLLTVN